MLYIGFSHGVKLKKVDFFYFFLIVAQNIDCGYTSFTI